MWLFTPGSNACYYDTYFRYFGPNPSVTRNAEKHIYHHSTQKYLRTSQYCSQTLASLYNLHQSPPDSGCRGSFDIAANYSLEDVLLLSKIASLLWYWNSQEQNSMGVNLSGGGWVRCHDNYSHYEQMSEAGHLLTIVTLHVTSCDTCIWCNTFVIISVTMTTGHNRSNMEWS